MPDFVRVIVITVAAGCIGSPSSCGSEALGQRVESTTLSHGNLSVVLRDNSRSPEILSGVDSLFHLRDAPAFDAFDPDGAGSSAGLNFEHVISGHRNAANSFTPRRGRYELFRQPDGVSAILVREASDDPWALASTFRYTLAESNAIDFAFTCRAADPSRFGERGYAVLFFANYMNDVAEVPIHFRGVASPGGEEQWITADARPGHPDFRQGGTFRSKPAADLAYDEDHDFKLNLWSYEYPRFTQPFYYGRAAHDMVLILMFDRMYSAEDEIRFSLFKFKVPRRPRPAWDFQYVIHRVAENHDYGFNGRLVWKRFVSEDDCLQEYQRWRASLYQPDGNRGRQGRK